MEDATTDGIAPPAASAKSGARLVRAPGLQAGGLAAGRALPEGENHAWRRELAAAALCGLFGLAGAFSPAEVSLVFYGMAYLSGGWYPALEVWVLLRQRVIDVHFLMLLVAGGSASIGGWGEGAALLFLFSLSGALESYAMGRTEREISSLFKSSPKSALVLRDGTEVSLRVEEVEPGMILLIKPGDLVPLDCELQSGQTACDESTLTGESAPVEKGPGQTLFSGTVNLWGAVQARALRPASESALSRIIAIIREAQQQKAPAQRFTDQFSSWYTYGVLAATALMFFVWWLWLDLPPFKGEGGQSAFYRSMTLLVVASPCALVLSIPSAVLSAIAFGAKRGILFRGGAAVERLADVSVVVMDKTGTVTTGDLRVETVESFPPGRENEVLALALSLESLSTHPLARAVTAHARRQGIHPVPLERFESVAGSGLRAVAGGAPVRLGKRDWVMEGAELAAGAAPGVTEVWVRQDSLAGRITLRDQIRENARSLIDELHRLGLDTVLLTGDRFEMAEHARAFLGIREVKGGLKPEEKLLVIGALKRSGKRVAMIGDGVNDAPSLAAADVGVAMGARGSDAALEQADIVLMHDRLENFLTALQLSKRARRVIRQNLLVSLGTVLVLVLFALAGRIPLTAGVIGHEGSTVLVVLNSLRLLLRGAAPPDAPSAPAAPHSPA